MTSVSLGATVHLMWRVIAVLIPFRNASRSFLALAGFLLTISLLTPFLFSLPIIEATVVVRAPLETGVIATIRGGKELMLECRPPKGDGAEAFFARYLEKPAEWTNYKNRIAVAIGYDKLNAKTRRAVLEAIFPHDYVDARGWWHTVVFEGEDGYESWWSLCTWFTGVGTKYKIITELEQNRGLGESLHRGQILFFPKEVLLEVMKTPKPPRNTRFSISLGASPNGELKYNTDEEGPYAEYLLKKGETVYTSVVARFTDFLGNKNITDAADDILKRSGIRNARSIRPGQVVRIPFDMLSDGYLPQGSERRLAYENTRRESKNIRAKRVAAKGLDGVVVILDPGHGGRDQGTAYAKSGLYEDELNYDIVCRIKSILEEETDARVYVTVKDPSQGYTPSKRRQFVHDPDEYLMTTPRYNNDQAKISANLRWYLANDIYLKELARGVDESNVLFSSIHCDKLYYKLRGTMVYIPGATAKNRRSEERPKGSTYDRYAEARAHRTVKSTLSSRKRDEAMSLDFASTLMDSLKNNYPPIKVHESKGAIRNVIRQDGGLAYVPAVLRGTMIPTKILVEAANIGNATDRKRLADPKWRQWFAEAFVKAVRKHFES
jgi:N-acetylmuramoyl-L-alanine amidase